jgi:hypothetical protein
MIMLELIDKFPLARARKTGHLPTIEELLSAYVWRMNGTNADTTLTLDATILGGMTNEDSCRKFMSALLFPLPTEVELECEVRALIAKVIVADGVWCNFVLGAPFDIYLNESGECMYTNEEAIQLGQMFSMAVANVGFENVQQMVVNILLTILMA